MASNRHATPIINHCVFICVAISLFLPSAADDFQNDSGDGVRLTREYHLTQGALRGFIVKPTRQYNLQEVEIFLGIPYAASPTGHLRFMPPVSAPPWSGVMNATQFAPVCPQALPPLKKGNPPPLGRQHYINRLKPFLVNESEDCLYLNIYVPHKERKPKPFPVLVFIHGDSFEWSSGNPYDGRILASYGNIMVITINFRLGILGFMKPSLTEHVYGNNGLLDQLAALQWIKDNIDELNGDPNSVTLMGHGTGGACVSFLMLSPISNGLFHRAILMSGSALSDWAMTKDPTPYTLQVAQSLGCHPTARDLMMCLQNKPLSAIKKVQILSREWETPLGPTVAGSFIPNEPWVTMETFPTLLSKYQLLSGVTENERYHDFGVIELDHGVLENQRDDFISKYVKLIYETADKHVLKEILDEYAPARVDPQRWSVEANRDVILNLFSDARTVAPLFSFSNYQSKANQQSYFYVFGHNSVSTEYASLNKSVHGEEMPYVFGIPLGGAKSHFHAEYTQKEKLLSEVMMRLWSNFVKFGTPNTQSRNEYYTMGNKYWPQYNIAWPEYTVAHQSILKLDIPPYLSSFYRSNYTNFWNEVLPSKMKRYLVDPLFEFTPAPISSTQKPKSTHKNTETKLFGIPTHVFQPVQHGSSYGTYGRMRPYSPVQQKHDVDEIYRQIQSIKTPARPIPSHIFDKPSMRTTTTAKPKPHEPKLNVHEPAVKSSATIAMIVGIVVFFVATNIGICTILYIRKVKRRTGNYTTPRRPFAGEVDLMGQKSNEDKKTLQNIKNGYTVIKTMNLSKIKRNSKKSDKKSEQCKTPKSDDSGGFRERFKLRKHVSTSTLDAQTKVSNWIKNEVSHRCSPEASGKSFSDLPSTDKNTPIFTRSEEILSEAQKYRKTKHSETLGEITKKDGLRKIKTSEKTTSTSALDSQSSLESKVAIKTKSLEKSTESLKSAESAKSKKVSVAVDATPAGRKEELLTILYSKTVSSNDKTPSSPLEPNNQVDEEILHSPAKLSQKTFTNEVTLTVDQEKPLKVSHKHSTSDPVTDFNYTKILQGIKESGEISDILPPVKFRNDINVTSRDDYAEIAPMSAIEALQNMKRRKFPKVLPDHPDPSKRLSLQPNSFKTFSGSFDSHVDRPKNPPQPPPRTSTLDRRFEFKNAKQLLSFDSCMKKRNEVEFLQKYETTHNLSPLSSLNTIHVSKTAGPRLAEPQDKTKKENSSTCTPHKVIVAQPANIPSTTSYHHSPSGAARVRLPDDFHSHTTGSVTPFSSDFSLDFDDLDEIDDEEAEDKLIQELVGSVESSTNMEDILDTKGPQSVYERKLEIVPVKINTGNTITNEKDYVCISDLHLPNLNESAQQTAQIKPGLKLSKLQRRSDSIQRPPEKAIKVKQKPTYSSTVLFNKSYKKPKQTNSKERKDRTKHSMSYSSNDTEASTETVKRVEVKRDSNYS